METSETEPLLQSPGDTSTSFNTQPPTPAPKAPKQGSKDLQSLSQDHQPSADALEEKREICSAADPVGRAEEREAAWNVMDFFGEEVEGEVKGLTQQEKVGKTEEEIKAVPEAQAASAELVAEQGQSQEQGQPGSEGARSAGMTLQEGNIPSLRGISREAKPGQGCEMEPPADTGGVLKGRGSSLPAPRVAGEPEPSLCAELLGGTDRAEISPAEISPGSPQWAELTRLIEAMSRLTLQSPSEVMAKLNPAEMSPQSPQRAELPCLAEAMSWLTLQSPSEVLAKISPAEISPQSPQWAELTRLVEAMSRLRTLQSPSEVPARAVPELPPSPPVSRESLCPQSGSLELPEPRKGRLAPAQGTGSLCCAGPEGPSELLQQPRALEEGDAEGKAAKENLLQVPLHLPCTELKAEEGGELSMTSGVGDEM